MWEQAKSFWFRVRGTKTFKVCAATVLASVGAAIEGSMDWSTAMRTCWASVLAICIRDALASLGMQQEQKNEEVQNSTEG